MVEKTIYNQSFMLESSLDFYLLERIVLHFMAREKSNFWHLFFPCHIYMPGIVSLYIRDSPHFKGCDYTFGSIIGWATLESNGFRQSLPQEESHNPREWKNIIIWLLLSLFILSMWPSCWYNYRLCDGKVYKRKGRIEFTFLSLKIRTWESVSVNCCTIYLRSQETHLQDSN